MLPKTTEYALRDTVWLERDPRQTNSADQIAAPTKVPRRYLHLVLQDMVHAGLVWSQAGPGGGYALNRDPKMISILDVVNYVAALERMYLCPLRLASHTKLYPLDQEQDKFYAATEATFARGTLDQKRKRLTTRHRETT